MQILAGWLLIGLITTLGGVAILLGLVHLSPNDPRGVGGFPLFFGCFALGASWLTARLASTVTFDLKQQCITITPKWQLGRGRRYRFDEIQSLQVGKRSVGAIPGILFHWRFFFILRNKKKITFGETYDESRRYIYIQSYLNQISLSTGISAHIDYDLRYILFL